MNPNILQKKLEKIRKVCSMRIGTIFECSNCRCEIPEILFNQMSAYQYEIGETQEIISQTKFRSIRCPNCKKQKMFSMAMIDSKGKKTYSFRETEILYQEIEEQKQKDTKDLRELQQKEGRAQAVKQISDISSFMQKESKKNNDVTEGLKKCTEKLYRKLQYGDE